MRNRGIILLVGVGGILGWNAIVRGQGDPLPSPSAPWLTGDLESRFQHVEKHLRGMDMTMVEVGYRYQELYWAGRDEDWEYAAYQLGKIEQSMANGIERRPARAESSRMMQAPVQLLRSVIEGKNPGNSKEPSPH